MTDTALLEVEEENAGGRPPEVVHNDAKDYLRAISEGMTQDQAADIVGFDRRTMEKWVKGHPELGAEAARARAKCIRSRIRAQQRIGDCTDIKGLNAAVKANACLLAAYDPRFRKARDGDGAGGGTSITVITAVQPQSVAGFFAAGGKAQPQAVKILVQKYGKAILGDITEETALRIAEDSVSENENGTQLEDRGGQRPAGSAIPIPKHPRNKTEIIEADVSEVPVETSVDSPSSLSESVEGPLEPVPAPAAAEEAPDGP